jgi:hypothetical protein
VSLHIIRKLRGRGKTEECISWLLGDSENRVIVVTDVSRATLIKQRLSEKVPPSFPSDWNEQVITWCQVRDGHLHGRKAKHVYIDQIDHILNQMLFPHFLKGITVDA